MALREPSHSTRLSIGANLYARRLEGGDGLGSVLCVPIGPEPARCAALSYRSVLINVEHSDLVTPRRPAGACLAGEELEVGAVIHRLDVWVLLIWFTAVFSPWRKDQVAHRPTLEVWAATPCQEALLTILPGAIARAEGILSGRGIELDPHPG